MHLSTLLSKIGRRLIHLSDKIEFSKCDPKVFLYRDCFDTIRVLNQFIKPKTLCDIGANSGNWTFVMHQLNPQLQHVVLFEPQKKLYQTLESLSLPAIQKVIYPYALGQREETCSIKGGTASASLLNAADSQNYHFPGSFKNEVEEVIKVKVLDEIYANDNLPYPQVIKIDVQGFELNVLRGAQEVLGKAKYLVIELSFCGFYSGQPNLWEVLEFLEDQGYSMVAHGHEWRSELNPIQLLQTDGIFVNTRNSGKFTSKLMIGKNS